MKKRPGAVADAHAITYDSRSRGAYIKVDEQSGADSLIKLCAEPPPDASANLEAESSFKAKIEAAAELEAIKATFDGDFARSQSATSTIADVATRTELVLFMRDALYRICEMNFNGVLSPPEAKAAFEEVIAAGRVLGQRDNVAKLVELAKAMMAVEAPDARLIHDVIGTIRFLAAADYVLAADGETAQTAGAALLTQVLGTANVESARQLMESQIKLRLAEIDSMRAAVATAKKRDKPKLKAELDAIVKEQKRAEQLYTDAFAPLPRELTLQAPEGAGDTIK